MSGKRNTAKKTADILVAEDSPTQSEALRYVLEQKGYRVTLARDGKKALACLNGYRPALVISDILMPEMNGYELCQHIKENEDTRNIPVILLTSLSEAADVMQGLACGADSFITKSYDSGYFLVQVEQAMANLPSSANGHPPYELEITLAGKPRLIRANPQRMVSLILSIYEAAIHRNTELLQTQDELRLVNEHLENLVEQRTATLSAEIIERERLQDELRSMSFHDGLTGLLNQRGFMTLAEQHCRLAQRNCQEFTLIYLDMDGLKQINDTLGHAQGDQALRVIARTMEVTFRQSDILARLGGDEFTVLLAGCDQSATRVAINHLEQNLSLRCAGGISLPLLSLSVGLAKFDPANPLGIKDLLEQADAEMYKQKIQKRERGRQ